ncbi:MAG: tRNA (cytidine(34)-2'-O)-methyltransferase [Spirochaetaceae bacterium]|nr:tRNA (cytidine(34)-2'-O)-methyltransferase [Spirochaetaceae bacterium]
MAVSGRDGAILHVVLYQPQIPQNTGNIARTCAAVGAALHLVEPLGFAVTDSAVRRAGLDYWSEVRVRTHAGLEPVLAAAGAAGEQLVLLSTHGTRPYTRFRYRHGCYLLFGNETADLRARHRSATARIPMRPGLRSLNLANSVAVVVYEALRQLAPPHLS